MNQLKIVSMNGQLVTNSRSVAKMINREHNGLMKSIRSYIKYLAEGEIAHSEFFIKSTYKDNNNQVRPCFLLTRKGCDMVANKMTGEKGVLFTAEYVIRFEEMERELNKPRALTDKEQRIEMLKLSLEHEEKIETIQSDVNMLKETMRIDGNQEHAIKRKANSIVVESLGGKTTPAYKEMAFKVFSAFWRDFKNHFEIPRYGELPKKKFEEGLRFIGMWQPSTSLKIEIDIANCQQTTQEVI
ncbi:ORF6C domain-containing protein [Virgibacillus halodenitrificans]|uniref:ORF6C domain-containing protein n=1 Tax=Virgibacillus halodenitrificans TaxID=1482 RepID=UPI000EF48570|nr:ORF6C domain-containing protein [Virgibacillus halodenitrificans]